MFRVVPFWSYEIARLSASAFCTCGIAAAVQHEVELQESSKAAWFFGQILCNLQQNRRVRRCN